MGRLHQLKGKNWKRLEGPEDSVKEYRDGSTVDTAKKCNGQQNT